MPPEEVERLAQRVTALEELFTHLQATVQALSEEVFAQARGVDALQREANALKTQVSDTISTLREQRRLEDEKPPHY